MRIHLHCLLPQPPKNGYLISESLGKITHSEYDPEIMKFIPEDEYVSFSCDEKYRIEGEERIYCEEGSLEHEVPVCVKKYCDSPPAIENGYYAKRTSKKRVFKKVTFREGTKLFVNCTEGYRHKIGSPKIVQCLRVKNDLLWSSDIPICEKYSQCGVDVRSPGRVFGKETKTYWPWMAMLRQFNKDDKTFYGFCGGSIIDRDWILTAAHCMYRGERPIKWNMRNPENVYVRLGYTKSLNDTNIQDIKSSKIYIHPDYFKLAKFDYDVALIKLAHSADYEERVGPVCLCPPVKDIPDESNLYAEKTKGWAIGFGIFSRERKDETETFKTLREVALEIRSDEECGNGLLGSAIKTYTTRMFCAGGEKDKDTCDGDSGGPFMKQQNNSDGTVSWIQTGITSFGPKGTCAKEGEYGYYTNVASVRNWIDKTIQVHGNNNCLLPQPPKNGYLISDHWGIITHSEYDPEIIKFVMENTSVSFSCDDKYKIVGKDKIYCQEGELEHEVPMCVTMSCEMPPSIENAVYQKLSDSGSAFNYGDQIRFACNNDLVLVGAKTLTCSVKGWSDDFPSCQAMNCENVDLSEGVEIERSTNPLNSQNKYPYQTEVFYKCASLNYELIGSSSQTCTENGWNGREPFCKLTGCLDPDIPENSRIYQTYKNNPVSKYYSFGDFALFSCTEGYKIEQESNQTENQASKSLCTSNGTWTKIPRCIEVYCLRPEHPGNGRYLNLLPKEGSHYPIDYVISYECDPGYTLQDPNIKSRKCHSNGNWTSYVQTCIEVTCDSPPKIPNARLQTTVHVWMTTGFKVAYACNDGHHMVPKGEDPPGLKCTETGRWSEPNFECQTITCDKPPDIENAVYEKLSDSGSTFDYGDEIRFDCLNNLVLDGAKTLKCTANGWSDDFPSCKGIYCDNVDLSEGVEIERSTNPLSDQNKYPYQTEIFYKCASLNYELVGSFSQTCTERGWNGRESFCILAGCLNPDIPKNGQINQRYRMRQKYYSVGDSVTFSCNWGYSIEKESYQTKSEASESRCTSDGTWTKIPRCIEIYCLRPEHPENGRYLNVLPEEGAHYPMNYVIPYECDPGYTLENPNVKSRKCHSNGKWTGYMPRCIEATCDSPPEIPNAILQTTVHESRWFGKLLRMTTGFKVTYGCRDGHHMVPKGEDPPGLTCTGTGQWSEPNFDCQGSQCGAPPKINDGFLSVHDHSEFYHVGYTAGVQCKRGFIRKKEEVTCLPNGKWDVDEPMCQRTLEDPLCGLPPPINNGHLWVHDQSEFYPVGYRAGVQCHPGFIQRKKQVTCQLDGMWDVEEVMCQRRSEALQCGPPPRIYDGTLLYYQRDSYPVGSRASVQCNPGFIKRKEEVTCLENGKWDVEDTLCQGSFKARGCGPVPPIENGVLVIYPSDELYFVGAAADVRCDRGFDQKTYLVACLENGNWNITGRECQIKETTCGKVPRIPNGSIQTPAGMQNYPVGTNANVICDQGFHSKKYVVICENDGHWQLQDINCIKKMKHCEKPPLIQNHGFIHDFNANRRLYPPGHNIIYECEPNYKLVPTGFKNNACTNKGWLHAAPECVAEWCDPVPEIEYGYLKLPRKGKLVPNEDQLKVLCNAGFMPTVEFLSCNLDGSWNLGNLRCQRDRSTDCNMPEPIENGVIENISKLKEATYPMEHPITYKCREGYVLEGDDKRFCSDGGWSGEAPICKVNYCTLPNRRNAENQGIIAVGNIYKIKCPKGQAVMDGSDTIKCLEGGHWNNSMPKCKAYLRQSCSKAEFSDERGQFVPVNENVVELRCPDNYIPLNFDVTNSTCDERLGRWIIPRDMTCVPMKPSKRCSEPASVPHGSISGLKEIPLYQKGDELILHCDRGYLLTDGTDRITCLASGYWDGVLATCSLIVCELGERTPNGEFDPPVEGYVIPYGKVINVKCNSGYQISQESSLLRCAETGWDSQKPSCKKIKCPDPGVPENGLYHLTSYDYGERVTFGCFSGYKLYGSKERVCLENGKWSGSLTLCDSGNQDCPEPGTPVNGIKSGTRHNEGNTVTYSCLSGYTLMGSRSRTCNNRTWTGREPQCIGKLDFDAASEVSQRLRLLLKQVNHFEDTGGKLVEIPKLNDNNRRPPQESRSLNSAPLVQRSMLVVCFMFDSSAGIGEENFRKSIKLAQALTQNMNISPSGTRTCALVFNSEAKVEISPMEFKNTTEAIGALSAIPYEEGKGTSFLSAFKTLEEEILNPTVESNPDKRITFLTLLFTDGKVKPDYQLKTLMRNLGVEFNLKVYCIALTGFPNKDVLFSMTSSYRNVKRIFLLDSYSTMDKITKDLMTADKPDYSVCGIGYDSSMVVNDLSNNNISDADHSALQRSPWTVQLFAIEGAKIYTPSCLGSLIDKEWVLTSGLCFPKNTDPRRILTKTGIDKYHLSIAERIVNIENRAEDNKMWTASAALIKLKKPVTFSQFVHPVCLPHAQEGFAKPHGPPKTGYSSSWSKGILNDRHGDIEKMHMAIQTVVNCRNSLNKALVGERELDPNIFCAVDNAGSLDVCGPDLGSPLYHYVVTSGNQAQWVQMGIASAFENRVDGEMKCLNPSRFYDLFLDVSRIVSSIRNIIKSS